MLQVGQADGQRPTDFSKEPYLISQAEPIQPVEGKLYERIRRDSNMSWEKTGCALCGVNCGLEVQVENNRIVKARPDKSNPRSEGYILPSTGP
jgi:predicted molibdopterin-dependent oxidoreductase YjgC